MSAKYRTIVADPPWDYGVWRSTTEPAYAGMSLDEIAALPVRDLADDSAHLYCWSVLPLMAEAFDVVRGWGFTPSTMLTWCKPGLGLGAGFRGNTEHLIVARRRSLPFLSSGRGTWYEAPRRGGHSAKPEMFLDLVEQMSPGPYLELFARRNRIGWDTWGNESLGHVSLLAEAHG